MGSSDQATRALYPRVKVREQTDPKSFQAETTDLLLKVIESLSLDQGHYRSDVPTSKHGNDYKSYSPSPRSGVSSPCMSNLSTSSVCNGSEGRNNKGLDQDKMPNVRASSVPRPRAVLSNPDNDDMIGRQNRLLWERERLLKVQTLRGSAAAQYNPTPKNIRVQSPVNKRKTTEVPSNNNGPKTKPSLIHEKTQSQTPAKGKPNPAWVF